MMFKAAFEELETRRLLTGPTATLLSDISPGAASTVFHEFAAAGDLLYFRANERELWRTDGTEGGTIEIDGIHAAGLSEAWRLSDNMSLVHVDVQGTTETEYQLWQTDGSDDGTRQLALGIRSTIGSSDRIDEADGNWWLVAIRHRQELEIWRVSQDVGETARLMTIPDLGQAQVEMIVQNETVLATLRLDSRDPQRFLLQSDGTIVGTKIIATRMPTDIVSHENPVTGENSAYFFTGTAFESTLHRVNELNEIDTVVTWTGEVTAFRSYHGKLLILRRGGADETSFWELVISDGTVEGMSAFRRDAITTDGALEFAHEFDDALAISVGSKLYRTDGSLEGTRFLFSSFGRGELGGRLYGVSGYSYSPSILVFTDGTRVFNAQSGQEILLEENPTPPTSPSLPPPPFPSFGFGDNYIVLSQQFSSNPGSGTGSRYFVPDENGVISELAGYHYTQPSGPIKVGDTWYVLSGSTILNDGISVLSTGTRTDELQDSLHLFDMGMVQAFRLGPEEDTTTWILSEDNQVRLLGEFELGNLDDLLFVGSTPEIGRELWVTNESVSVVLPIDILPGRESSNPTFISASGEWSGPSIVIANTPDAGRELWVIEGEVEEQDGYVARLPLVHHHDEEPLQLSVELERDTVAQRISWDLNNDGVFDDAEGATPNLSPNYFRELTPAITRNAFVPYHVRVEMADGQTFVGSSLWRIDNRAPAVAAPTEIPKQTMAGEEIQIDLNVHDIDELHYKVDFGDGNVIEPDSTTFVHAYAASGEYKIIVTVEDTHSSQTVYETRITVDEPTLEAAAIFEPGPVFGDNEGTVDVRLWDPCYTGFADWIYTRSDSGETEMYFRLDDPIDFNSYRPELGNCVIQPSSYMPVDDSERMPLGDMNGDEHIDFATIEDGAVQVMLGAADTESPRSTQEIRIEANYVFAADLDADNDLDLVLATNGANRIWLNDGDGQFFDSGQRLGAATTAHGEASDLDGDGDIDLVFANGVGFGNTVWLNDGKGTLVDSGARIAPHWDTKRVALDRISKSNFARVHGYPDAVFAVANGRNHIYWNTRNQPVRIVSSQASFNGALLDSLRLEFNKPISSIDEIRAGGLFEGGGYGRPSRQDLWLSSDHLTVESKWRGLVAGKLDVTVIASIEDETQPLGFSFIDEVVATYDADLDQDFDVDEDDFALLAKNYGVSNAALSHGDINGDGEITFADFLILSNNYTG